MNKVIILALTVLSLVACDSRPIDQRGYTKRTLSGIPELADCTYISVEGTGMSTGIVIVRCPNSSTTVKYSVSSGKSRKSYETVVVSE